MWEAVRCIVLGERVRGSGRGYIRFVYDGDCRRSPLFDGPHGGRAVGF